MSDSGRRWFAIISLIIFIVSFGCVMYFAGAKSSGSDDANHDINAVIELEGPWDLVYRYGDEVVLACRVRGLIGDYVIEWEYSEDGEAFRSLDCTGEYYKYVLTEENEGYEYRVLIHY